MTSRVIHGAQLQLTSGSRPREYRLFVPPVRLVRIDATAEIWTFFRTQSLAR